MKRVLEYKKTLKLISLAKKGDEEAKDALILHNSPLVKSIVKRYKNKGVEYDDLYQLGCVGFVKAVNNFDENFKVRFSTYAVPMIAGEIKRFLRDDGSVKVSRSIKGQCYLIQRFIDEFRQKNDAPPSTKEISKRFNIDETELMFVLESSRMPISIYDSIDNENSSGQMVVDRLYNQTEQDDLLNKMVLFDALRKLEKKDKKLIILRYFRDKTQSEVAKILGVSQVQISRLESKILAKMKNKLRD